jgi:SAM-dependent methyltransferase
MLFTPSYKHRGTWEVIFKNKHMNRWITFLIILLSINLASQAQNKEDKEKSPYKYTRRSYDGIGKMYMGREISFVMGFAGKDWLERRTRELEEGVSLAIENLPVTDQSVVADIGAGSGYYTFRIAPRVPQGKVYAVEIQQSALTYLGNKSRELGLNNVVPIMGSETSPNLPENAIDLAIMVDVYHELEYPVEMLQALHKSLKPDGKILLIEYRGEDESIPIKPLHKMTERQVRRELEANGFTFIENKDFMPIQHFLIFGKK